MVSLDVVNLAEIISIPTQVSENELKLVRTAFNSLRDGICYLETPEKNKIIRFWKKLEKPLRKREMPFTREEHRALLAKFSLLERGGIIEPDLLNILQELFTASPIFSIKDYNLTKRTEIAELEQADWDWENNGDYEPDEGDPWYVEARDKARGDPK